MTAVDPRDITVAMIAKEPVPGRVKTRLCPPCTPAQAAELATAAIGDTLVALKDSVARRTVMVLDGEVGDWLPTGMAAGVEVVPQRGGGLDERLAAAIEDLGAPLLIVGMDTPQLVAADVDAALVSLCAEGVDAVLGPASDGGFWTLGVRAARPDCVHGVPMSRSDTGRLQRERLDQLGWTTTELAEHLDVDTFDDAVAVARLRPHSRFARAVADLLHQECRP